MPKEAKVVVKEVRKKEPDLRKLARALIQLAIAQVEAHALEEGQVQTPGQQEAS